VPGEDRRERLLIAEETVRVGDVRPLKQWDFVLERAADVLFQVEARGGDPIYAFVMCGVDDEQVQWSDQHPHIEHLGLLATGSAASATSSPGLSKVVRLKAGMHSLVASLDPDDVAEPLGFAVVHVAIHKSESE